VYKEILRGIAGIEVFPVISLVLFVVLFAVILGAVARMDRRRADRLASLPLDLDVPPEA
jgi:hypothetical protein